MTDRAGPTPRSSDSQRFAEGVSDFREAANRRPHMLPRPGTKHPSPHGKTQPCVGEGGSGSMVEVTRYQAASNPGGNFATPPEDPSAENLPPAAAGLVATSPIEGESVARCRQATVTTSGS